MRVLIIEESEGRAEAAANLLGAAGHSTVSCHTPDMSEPCAALEPGSTCPLEESPVDVALLVGGEDDHPRHTVAQGYVCARRWSIPIVSLGDGEQPSVTSRVRVVDDVVPALEGAAAQPLPEHTEVSRAAVREVLDRHDLGDVDSTVSVERHEGRLEIRVHTSEPISPMVAHTAGVRAMGAVRAMDEHAPTIGVSVGS